ncbi:lactam utilization protein lamb [Mycena vulgaris]|nr:lactam utilization protein lamb [Mycena vulgaris]
MAPLKATVNCDMGEGFSIYNIADDAALMQTIHLANIACGFHASDFAIMDTTVAHAKGNGVAVGAHPSLPDRQGFGRREMAVEPDELRSCFVYQIGALAGFLKFHDLPLNHVKPHGAVYGQTARSLPLAHAVVAATKAFSTETQKVAFIGLAGTAHQTACAEAGVRFIAEWFADLDYDPSGKLLITKKHVPVSMDVIRQRVTHLLETHQVTTNAGGYLPLGEDVTEVSICCHSDTPGAVEIATLVKSLVDESNKRAGYTLS